MGSTEAEFGSGISKAGADHNRLGFATLFDTPQIICCYQLVAAKCLVKSASVLFFPSLEFWKIILTGFSCILH